MTDVRLSTAGGMTMDGFVTDDRHAVDADEVHDNWGTRLVIAVLYPFALIAAPAFLLALQVYFVASAFDGGGVGAGIRSLAAVLLPLMVLTYLVQADPSARQAGKSGELRVWVWTRPVDPEKEGRRQALAFAGCLLAGALVMSTLQLSTTIPVGEFAASGAFSVLVGSLAKLDRKRYVSYFFGFILGVLGFITLLGGDF